MHRCEALDHAAADLERVTDAHDRPTLAQQVDREVVHRGCIGRESGSPVLVDATEERALLRMEEIERTLDVPGEYLLTLARKRG